MAGMKISDLDFLRLLPAFMRDDDAVNALANAMNRLFGDPDHRIDTIRTWDKFDELNEAECDEMAWELDVDWYDSVGMSLTEKRETLKVAQQVKRKRGTKWAVERLITAYFGEGYVMEWYEMGGEPFTFSVLTTETYISPENYTKFMQAANAAKNERSRIAGVFYFEQQGPDPGVEVAPGTSLHKYEYTDCGTVHRPATIGIVVRHAVETEPEVKLHKYGYTEAGDAECGENCVKATLGAAIVGTAIVGKAIIRD